MPLTPHFPNCFRQGTSWHESGNRINVVPQQDETVKFFVIDPESNSDCTFRQSTGLSGPICDIIVTFLKGRDQIQIICLLEMKGNKLNHAIQQISNTYDALTRYHEDFKRANYRGYILIRGSAPIKLDDNNKRNLVRIFGQGNFTITRQQNKDALGAFLRKSCNV